jgi:hypothetical protein
MTDILTDLPQRHDTLNAFDQHVLGRYAVAMGVEEPVQIYAWECPKGRMPDPAALLLAQALLHVQTEIFEAFDVGFRTIYDEEQKAVGCSAWLTRRSIAAELA